MTISKKSQDGTEFHLDKTHILCSVIFFFKNRVVYEIISKNIVEWGMPQMTLWCMRIAFCTTNTTDTRSERVILIALPLQQ
jgi:hypothetical protein